MLPPFTEDAEIGRIARGLIARNLPKPEWTHAAHFAAALWLIRHRGTAATMASLPGLIRAYNEATGVPNTESTGYHETITLASIRAAAAFHAAHPADRLFCVCNRLLDTRFGHPDWLLAHWSTERLFSPEARCRWVRPDRSEF